MENQKMISGFLRYPGGKTKYQKRFIKYIPENFNEARFPFVGGGGIFWLIDPKKKRWINDIDENLMSVYFALKYRAEYFIKQCKMIKPEEEGEPRISAKENGKTEKTYNERLKKMFDYFVDNLDSDPALRYLFINRTNWSGRVNYDPNMASRMYFWI